MRDFSSTWSQSAPDWQVVLAGATRISSLPASFWTDPLIFPLYAALGSLLLLSVQYLRRLKSPNAPEKSWQDVDKYGGPVVLIHNVLRLLASSTLVALSAASAVVLQGVARQFQVGYAVFYIYTTLLSFPSIAVTTRYGATARAHLNVMFLAAFAALFYRDMLPQATISWPVLDAAEGSILTAKLIILSFAAIVIPVLTPRAYIPTDPDAPMTQPSPEQTASLWSLLMFNFVDPVILEAFKLPHLPLDKFPPLADSSRSEVLKRRGFPNIDTFSGASNHHIFWGIIKTFRSEYSTLTLLLVVYVCCSFASPIGINRVLSYLEKGQGESSFKPFVWIAWLALGPMTGTIAIQSYYRISNRILVQVEGLLTELIFEHALRIRVKAHTDSGPKDTTNDDAASTDETLNQDGAESVASSTTAQGDASTTSKDAKKAASRPAVTSVDTGKISNLVTTDLRNLTRMSDFLLLFFYMPTSVVFAIIFLYVVLGWSSFVGMFVMVLLFPASGYVGRFLQNIQKNRIRAADARINTITETMNVLRMIKLFGWESKMLERVNVKREDELVWIWKREIFEWVANTVNNVIPIITMLATYVTYTMPVFDILRQQLHMVNYRLIQFIDAKVSIDRINDYLHDTELLDAFAGDHASVEAEEILAGAADTTELGFRAATFAWSNDQENDGTLTPSRQRFRLQIDDELIFRRGCFNLILGPTGSGKTSMLMALLGEMHFMPSTANSWYNLPRAGGVAYAAQESWVLNDTIRNNILFGAEYDEERYKQVLYQCALERDLELFEAGDQSEVGEKGLTLSGGQKARCTLARAIYSKAEILLLDDVLAALDVHTSKHIVEKCFAGSLVRGRTVILVTHNVALTSPIADFTVSIGSNGRISSQGSIAEVIEHDVAVAAEANQELQALEEVVDPAPVEDQPSKAKSDGKLILAEEVQLGKVKFSALGLYLAGLGGVGFYIAFFGLFSASHIMQAFQTWYLGYFASLYETSPTGTVSVAHHLGVYSSILAVDVITHSIADVVFAFACLRASRTIHRQLMDSILGTTLRWLDKTPASRVIARFTADIAAVDSDILNVFAGFWQVTLSMIVSFSAVVLLTPLFTIPGIGAAIIGGLVGQLFIKAQLSVKRESSNAKAPVLAHFGAAINGLTSIRAYDAQGRFVNESLNRINVYTRAQLTLNNLDRWVGIRLAVVGNMLSAILALYLVYHQKERSNNVGFSLNMAAAFSGRILFWVRLTNEVQIQGNSLERIQQYIEIEQEPKATESGKPPAHWPSSGELAVEKLSARYSPDGPKVLKDISFDIKAGERVGIVGRTGSGKSSLTLALLRCIFTGGNVVYDGMATSGINLEALRSNITIIPQMPELLSGSLRYNLDPFGQHDDATLNAALRSAGLFSLQDDMDDGRLTLDSPISSGGANLSVGQRQILALARAMVRESKLLILDEATSAIDFKTDGIIQASLRNELKSDVTVITVAHRLHTILDSDKIMVLDEGNIVEFDSPKVLLQNPHGKLRALVDESGDKETLYAMAGRAEQ
ncbi:unnamed protein product [Mycena citricolor]|uniref:P-loop containing nucleoside triphosphate hydrolase protein n=1 Tax=Mycena citricolor TaxID=2018698 RepID=A0AAD2HFM3_9AGAR|nr:unnamed protein product [Mycena citricolor]